MGKLFWTKEKCREEALKYETRKDFQVGSSSAYRRALRNGFLNEICDHMKGKIQKKRGYWTKERCSKEAVKYDNRTEFKDGSPSAYGTAHRKGWVTEITFHMGPMKKVKGYWNKKRCIEEGKKYHSRDAFQHGSRGAYRAAKKNGWFEETCAHMKTVCYPRRWNKETCIAEARKFDFRDEFRKAHGGAYDTGLRNGWLDEMFEHMEYKSIPQGYWTKERCAEEAFKYDMLFDFRKDCPGAYWAIHRNCWSDELLSHMKRVGNKFHRCVYKIQHFDKVYYGLTSNFEKRDHSYGREEIADLRAKGDYVKMTPYIPAETAGRVEKLLIKQAKDNPQLECLNIKSGGQLGWIKERI